MTAFPKKITFGELRKSGVRDVLVYFPDHHCSHHVTVSADRDRWPDHVRLSDIEPSFTCSACGKRGADVRPLFEPERMGTDAWQRIKKTETRRHHKRRASVLSRWGQGREVTAIESQLLPGP